VLILFLDVACICLPNAKRLDKTFWIKPEGETKGVKIYHLLQLKNKSSPAFLKTGLEVFFSVFRIILIEASSFCEKKLEMDGVLVGLSADLHGVIHTPFDLDRLVDDYQKAGSGSCHVVSSVILAHAHQSNHALAADDSHDSVSLREYIETRFNTLICNGGVPSRAFGVLLGPPIETLLLEQADLASAYQRVITNGGVLPYIPADVLVPQGRPYILVTEAEMVAGWNEMERADSRWHSLAVLGVVASPQCNFFLCKQSWLLQPRWILIPMMTSESLDRHQDLWKIYTPVRRFMSDAYKVSSHPIALQDGSSEPPDSRADDPLAFSKAE